MQIVMTSRDKADLLAVQGMKDIEGYIAAVAVGRDGWGLYAVSK